jgi:hypothetical protein
MQPILLLCLLPDNHSLGLAVGSAQPSSLLLHATAAQNKKARPNHFLPMRKYSSNQILAVACPTCGAVSGEKCELSTGLPRRGPHQARRWNASDLRHMASEQELPGSPYIPMSAMADALEKASKLLKHLEGQIKRSLRRTLKSFGQRAGSRPTQSVPKRRPSSTNAQRTCLRGSEPEELPEAEI